MSEIQLASLHNHTVYSDGRMTPQELARELVRRRVVYPGITDHFTAAGVRPFLEEVGRLREQGHTVVPVMGVEVLTREGDLLVYTATTSQVIKFVRWAGIYGGRQETNRYPLSFVVRSAYKEIADCFIVAPHVNGLPPLNALSIGDVAELVNSDWFTPDMFNRFGIEVVNFGNTIFQPFYLGQRIERRLHEFAQVYGLRMFGGADAHDAWTLSRQFTLIKTNSPTAHGLLEAIRKNKVSPNMRQNISLSDWTRLVGDMMKSFVSYRNGHNGQGS